MDNICRRVAAAICTVSERAGSTEAGPNDVETRANRLIDPEVGWGDLAYIEEGDVRGWAPGCAATLFLEQGGTANDCGVPLDYYRDGIDVGVEASNILGDHYIEFINAAVAAVYRI